MVGAHARPRKLPHIPRNNERETESNLACPQMRHTNRTKQWPPCSSTRYIRVHNAFAWCVNASHPTTAHPVDIPVAHTASVGMQPCRQEHPAPVHEKAHRCHATPCRCCKHHEAEGMLDAQGSNGRLSPTLRSAPNKGTYRATGAIGSSIQ